MKRSSKKRHVATSSAGGSSSNADTEKKTVCIETTAKVSRAILNMVTRESLSFRILKSSSFQSLVNTMTTADVAINGTAIRADVKEAATKIKLKIANELKGRMFCLKLDEASRFEDSILGINAQFILNDKVTVRTLDMVDMDDVLSAENLIERMEYTLGMYGCTMHQVCSITTDDGSNILMEYERMCDDDEDEDEDEIEYYEEARAIFNLDPLDDYEMNNTLKCVRCASNTIQLVVMDVLDLYGQQIEETRNLVNSVRSDQIKLLFKANHIAIPPIDVPKRWNSTFLMVKSITDNKEFYKTLEDIQISDELWDFIDELNVSFQPVHVFTMELQTKAFSIGDFIISWIKLKMNLTDIQSAMAKQILDIMEKRQVKLVENVVVKAALYIDPRFNFAKSNSPYLSEQGKNEAEEYLVKLFATIQSLEMSSGSNQPFGYTTPDPTMEIKLEQFYSNELGVSESADEMRMGCIKEQVAELKNQARASLQCDVWQLWQEKKKSNPDLYKLAITMLAVPSSQVSVKDAFNALELVVANRPEYPEYYLNEEDEKNLKNLLIIKANFGLMDE